MTLLICGEALYDMFLDREDDDGTLRFEARIGGSPFNVAVGISRLGGQSALLTGISRDMLGVRLAAALEREGVNTDFLIRSGRRTTLSLVGLDADGVPAYMFYGLGSADCNVKPKKLPPLTADIDGLHFGSYSLVVKPVARAFSKLLRNAGERFVSVDPNVRTMVEPDLDIWRERVAEYAARADLLKISTEDIEALYPGEDPEQRAADWIAAGVELVVVTDGGDAVHAWKQDGLTTRVTPPKSEVIDTVGAGDTFQATMLTLLQEAGDLRGALRDFDRDGLEAFLGTAARAAAITCSRRGADLPRRADLGL